MNARSSLLAVCFAIACSAGTSRSHAADIKRIGIQGGLGGMLGGNGDFAGGGGGITGAYGITDALTLRADAVVTSNQVAAKGGRSLVLWQSVGVQYALDVLQFVPYFGLHAGLYEVTGGGVSGTDVKFGAQVSGGLDYVYSRDFIFGLEVRGHMLPQDIAKSPSNPTPFYLTVFLKAEYAWGWF